MKLPRVFILGSAFVLLFGAGCSTASSTIPVTPIQPSTQQPSVQTLPNTQTAPALAPQMSAVIISNFAFQPSSLKVKVGTVVSWRNEDAASHTIVGDQNEFVSDAIPTKAVYSFTFTKPGTYTYHCSLHPSMKGTIIVE